MSIFNKMFPSLPNIDLIGGIKSGAVQAGEKAAASALQQGERAAEAAILPLVTNAGTLIAELVPEEIQAAETALAQIFVNNGLAKDIGSAVQFVEAEMDKVLPKQ